MNVETFKEVNIALFFIIHMFMLTYMVTCGSYMLLSKRSAFVSDVVPNPRLRKITGWNLYLWSFSYLNAMIWCFLPAEIQHYCGRLFVLLDLMIIPGVGYLLLNVLQRTKVKHWLYVPQYPIVIILFILYAITKDNIYLALSVLAWAGYIVIYLYFYRKMMKRYNKLLRQHYSNLEHKAVTWLMRMGIYFTIYFIMYVWQNVYTLLVLPRLLTYIATIVLWTYICKNVERQERLKSIWHVPMLNTGTAYKDQEISRLSPTEVLVDVQSTSTPMEEETIGNEAMSQDLEWVGQLMKKHCEDTKLYLKSDLTIENCAREIGTNRTYIGRYLAQKGMTYYTYINKLRIEHALDLLRKGGGKLNYSDAALKSGYRNSNTFRRAFKEVIGMLPSQYLEEGHIPELTKK